ncbi:hypothetical protein ACFSFW_11495 [Fredinandcohnia salidurans]|uniref:Uncharacterized protein n=1 Tax=Fredinandcohnia salidurans TaxID=2595041 RepID=A0ABW4MMY1_9BACI
MKKIRKLGLLSTLSITLLGFTLAPVGVKAEEIVVEEVEDYSDPYTVDETVVNQNYIEEEAVVDKSFVGTTTQSGGFTLTPTNPIDGGVSTNAYNFDCGCGGSYGSPLRIKTSTVDLYGTPIEYGFVNGQFVVMKRPDLYYYIQNATQSHFNMVTGKFAQTWATGFGTFVVFKGVDKIPYMARLFDRYNYSKPYNFGDYAKTVASWQLQSYIPGWAKVITTGVPSAGTKQVLVYVSTSGKNGTWHKRILFTITPNKTVSYSKSYAN